MSSCKSPGATHHMGCDCREAAHAAEKQKLLELIEGWKKRCEKAEQKLAEARAEVEGFREALPKRSK